MFIDGGLSGVLNGVGAWTEAAAWGEERKPHNKPCSPLAPNPVQSIMPLPPVQSKPLGGSKALSRGGPRRQSPSHPFYLLRTASCWLEGHNVSGVVTVFLSISLYQKADNYMAIQCCHAVPTVGPEGGVTKIPSWLQVVWSMHARP